MVSVTPQNSLQCPLKCGRWTAKALHKHFQRHHPDHPDTELTIQGIADKYKVTDEEYAALKADEERKNNEFEEVMYKMRTKEALKSTSQFRTSLRTTTITASVSVVAECSPSSNLMCAVCGKRAAVERGLRCKGCLGRARRFKRRWLG